jgi:hypothetical protein
MILNNLFQNDLTKNSLSSVTATNGNTLNLMEQQLPISIGFIISLVGLLTLISLLYDQPIILKLMKEKILKIFGNEKYMENMGTRSRGKSTGKCR